MKSLIRTRIQSGPCVRATLDGVFLQLTGRLVVIPLSLLLVLILVYVNTRSLPNTLIVLLAIHLSPSVPSDLSGPSALVRVTTARFRD